MTSGNPTFVYVYSICTSIIHLSFISFVDSTLFIAPRKPTGTPTGSRSCCGCERARARTHVHCFIPFFSLSFTIGELFALGWVRRYSLFLFLLQRPLVLRELISRASATLLNADGHWRSRVRTLSIGWVSRLIQLRPREGYGFAGARNDISRWLEKWAHRNDAARLSILRAAATTICHNLFARRCTCAFTLRRRGRRHRRRLLHRQAHIALADTRRISRRNFHPRGSGGKRIARQIPQIAGARATQLCDVMSDVAAIYPVGRCHDVGKVLIRVFLKCNHAYRYSFASMFNARARKLAASRRNDEPRKNAVCSRP